MNRNLFVLFFSQIFSFTAAPVTVFLSGIIGSQISPLKSLACPRKNYKMPKDQIKRRQRANEIAKVIFPLLTVPFNLLYFTINLI